jgi:hypothetical protein
MLGEMLRTVRCRCVIRLCIRARGRQVAFFTSLCCVAHILHQTPQLPIAYGHRLGLLVREALAFRKGVRGFHIRLIRRTANHRARPALARRFDFLGNEGSSDSGSCILIDAPVSITAPYIHAPGPLRQGATHPTPCKGEHIYKQHAGGAGIQSGLAALHRAHLRGSAPLA